MATRPAWCIKGNRISEEKFDFKWVSGLNITPQKKCALSLADAIREKTGRETLEVSTKSSEDLGASLSAFSLRLNGYYLENVFQASKNGESLSFIVHYAKDGFISKIETCSESSESFIHLVETGVLIDERSL